MWTFESCNTGYSQLRHLPVPEAATRAFHITVNSPLLEGSLTPWDSRTPSKKSNYKSIKYLEILQF